MKEEIKVREEKLRQQLLENKPKIDEIQEREKFKIKEKYKLIEEK